MRAACIAGAVALVLGTAGPAIAHPWAERRAEVVDAYNLEPIWELTDDELSPVEAQVIGRRLRILKREHEQWEANMAKLEREREAAEEAEPAEVAETSSTGSSNGYVEPWGCEADELHENDNPPYYGKYQFDRETWYAHGGSDCYESQSCSEAEQDAVAARVAYDAWPNC